MTEYPKKKKMPEDESFDSLLPDYDYAYGHNDCYNEFSTALRERASVESILNILNFEVVVGDYEGQISEKQAEKLATAISNHILNGLEG